MCNFNNKLHIFFYCVKKLSLKSIKFIVYIKFSSVYFNAASTASS